MQTYLFSSHGGHVPVTKKKAEVITLPENVVVIMNCRSKNMTATKELDSAVWSFVTNAKLHLAMGRNRFRLPDFVKYLEALMNLPNSRAKVNNKGKEENLENLFCIFTEKCPNLLLEYEKETFRTGLMKAPIKITYKNRATEENKVLTSELFTAYGQDWGLSDNDQDLIQKWLFPKEVSPYGEDRFAVKPKMIHFGVNDQLKLANLIKDISQSNPDTMNVIVVYACRAGVGTSMEMRKYEVTFQPLATALAFYDKFMKFRLKHGF